MFLFDTEVRNFYDGRMFMHQVSEYKKSQFITQVKILVHFYYKKRKHKEINVFTRFMQKLYHVNISDFTIAFYE